LSILVGSGSGASSPVVIDDVRFIRPQNALKVHRPAHDRQIACAGASSRFLLRLHLQHIDALERYRSGGRHPFTAVHIPTAIPEVSDLTAPDQPVS
jgi:hypothetical protein